MHLCILLLHFFSARGTLLPVTSMALITDIQAREILNSKGNPTLEVLVFTDDNSVGRANCPSGTSTGTYEAFELKDGDASRYKGGGMLKAIAHITDEIKPALIGKEVSDQTGIDQIMIQLDNTTNKTRLGANTILTTSMAVAKAAAKSAQLPLYLYLRQFINTENLLLRIPTPLFNIINGGKHAGENINMQEFIVTPATSKSYSEGLEMGVTIYKELASILYKNSLSTLVGDEGGYGPNLNTNEEALSLIAQAIKTTEYRLGYDIFTGIDAAGSEFYSEKKYHIKDRGMPLSAQELSTFYQELIEKYNIIYLEDPMQEDDFEGWTHLHTITKKDTIIVGDDLTVTNPLRLQLALDKNTIGGIIIKPNQIGSVMESIAVVEMARAAGIKVIVSHRSGETNDDFIADFAVAVSADYVKFGAPARGERLAKYNRLLVIEEQIKNAVQAV